MRKTVRILAILAAAALVCVTSVDADAKKTTQKKPAKTTAVKPAAKGASKSNKAKGTKAKKPAESVRSSDTVKKEQQKTRREIDETKKKITENERQTRAQLNRLEELNGQISAQEATINELRDKITEIETRRARMTDTIAVLKDKVSVLKKQVAKTVRESRVRRHQINSIGFLFSANTFGQASRRFNYLHQLERAMSREVGDLRVTADTLAAHEMRLGQLVCNHTNVVNDLTAAKSVLDSRKTESKKVVDNLKNEQATLNRVLAEKRAYAKRLDEELDRIIAEEARRKQSEQKRTRQSQTAKPTTKPGTKPAPSTGQSGVADADRALTGSFVSNRGRLLFPVAGQYTIISRFGKSNYGGLDHVEVNNSGIDISVAPGTSVRSVFDGEVSSIFFLNGYENVVIIRHGEYLTVYAGLKKISVSKGAKVKAGQTIGTVATADGRSVLHFEVRKERAKLNPLDWVK